MWQLDGEGSVAEKRRMDTCVRVAELLCCPRETIIALLMSSTPVQNKKLKILPSGYLWSLI